MLNLYLNFYLRHQRAAATTCLLLGVFYAAETLCIDVIFTKSRRSASSPGCLGPERAWMPARVVRADQVTPSPAASLVIVGFIYQ